MNSRELRALAGMLMAALGLYRAVQEYLNARKERKSGNA